MATTHPIKADELRLDGHVPLRPGRELTIRGLGRCRFGSARLDESGAVLWVDVFDRRNGGQHSVTVDRISAVHVKAKLR